MLKLSTILVICLLSFTTLSAGNNDKDLVKTYSLTGKVVDSDGELIGVQVTLDKKNITVYTDIEGNFVINNVEAGVQTISFNMVSYKGKTLNVNPSQGSNLEVRLYSK